MRNSTYNVFGEYCRENATFYIKDDFCPFPITLYD